MGLQCEPEEVLGAIELQTAYGMGRTGAFNLGGNYTGWQIILKSHKIEFYLVSPKKWKNVCSFPTGADKKYSLEYARAMWPNAGLTLMKHHGRAEALLIAGCVWGFNRGPGLFFSVDKLGKRG
jgi:hypothetical protein